MKFLQQLLFATSEFGEYLMTKYQNLLEIRGFQSGANDDDVLGFGVIISPEDGGSMIIRNDGMYGLVYTTHKTLPLYCEMYSK